jgi:hypothetical protein
MNTTEAITAFSQSEKVKYALIALGQTIELSGGLSEEERRGAEKVIQTQAHMISQELHLARRLTGDAAWDDAEKHLQKAIVMIHSHLVSEAGYHLTRALSHVTGIGQRSMSLLREAGLL